MDKSNMGALFDSIAGTYDKFNHLLSLNIDKKWRKRAVKALKTNGGDALDVATGTGDLAIALLKAGRCTNLTGIDVSKEMLKIAKEKLAKEGLEGKVALLEASALDIPFEAESFDIVSCAYGVRNFSDPDQGLREMYRVLRSGGELIILEFSYPGNAMLRAIYNAFFTKIMPIVGRLVSKNPEAYRYFAQSVKGFFWGEEMASHLRAAGFSQVRFKTMTFGITTLYYARK